MTVRSKNARQDTKRVGYGREREVVGQENGKKGRNQESINLHEQHVTEFLNKSCMFAYEWYCMTMCKCFILIVNLPTEYEGIDQFMFEREDKQMKQNYYVTFSQKLD